MPGQMQGLGCCFTGWAHCQVCSTYFPGPLGQLEATTPVFTLLLWTAKLLLTIDPGPSTRFILSHSQQHYWAGYTSGGIWQTASSWTTQTKNTGPSCFKQRVTFYFEKEWDKSTSPNAFAPWPSPTSQISGFVFIYTLPTIQLGGKGTEWYATMN